MRQRLDRTGGGRRRQRGYLMVMLLIAVTIMGILLTKAYPYAIADVRRDQEAELIFRGEAIAKAIRLYQLRTGHYPTRLADLETVRPRLIRRVYRDPMTKSGEWQLQTGGLRTASGDTTGLPITGVSSKSEQDSYKVYKGRTMYSDWIFSATDSLFDRPGGPRMDGSPAVPQGADGSGGKDGSGGGGKGGGQDSSGGKY